MCNSFSFLMHPVSSFWHPVFILLFSTHFFIHIRNKILTSLHLVHLDPAVAVFQLSWAQPHHLPKQAGGPKETTQFLNWQTNSLMTTQFQNWNQTSNWRLHSNSEFECRFGSVVLLAVFQAAPLPTVVGQDACSHLGLHLGCGTP